MNLFEFKVGDRLKLKLGSYYDGKEFELEDIIISIDYDLNNINLTSNKYITGSYLSYDTEALLLLDPNHSIPIDNSFIFYRVLNYELL